MVAYLDQAGVQHLIAKIRDTFWPVGTILATTSTASPASYLGGSWEAYAPGRTLVGVDEKHPIGSQGGSESIDVGQNTNLATAMYIDDKGNIQCTWKNGYHSSASVKTGFSFNARAPINWSSKSTGSGTKVAGVLPIESPYISVHYWRRVA